MAPVVVLLVACAPNRALVDVPVSTAPASAQVEPAPGVVVTIDTATLAFEDLRFESPATESLLRRLSPLPVAYAHPGHDFAGGVSGELAGSWTVDLLGPAVLLGDAACYEGAYATARLTLDPEPLAVLAGEAVVGDQAFPFRFELAPDQEVTGIAFDHGVDAEDPPVGITLGFDLGHALSFVDWATPDGDADGVLTVADGALDNTALFGLVATPTYTFTLEN